MCRNILRLRQGSRIHDRSEMDAAALQYVRKVTGFRQPSRANEAAFVTAVGEIADATDALMNSLVVRD